MNEENTQFFFFFAIAPMFPRGFFSPLFSPSTGEFLIGER